jgi:hypothetical protein
MNATAHPKDLVAQSIVTMLPIPELDRESPAAIQPNRRDSARRRRGNK